MDLECARIDLWAEAVILDLLVGEEETKSPQRSRRRFEQREYDRECASDVDANDRYELADDANPYTECEGKRNADKAEGDPRTQR